MFSRVPGVGGYAEMRNERQCDFTGDVVIAEAQVALNNAVTEWIAYEAEIAKRWNSLTRTAKNNDFRELLLAE
jgi:hypothetical protein